MSNQNVVDRMSDHGAPELRHALESATSAAKPYAQLSRRHRAHLLREIGSRLEEDRPRLVKIAADETALGNERLDGELTRTTKQLAMFASVITEGSYLESTIDLADPTATPASPDIRRMLHPLGPVAVYAASNFPFAFSVAGGDTASALAAGCPVVVKAHPGHPRLSARVAQHVASAMEQHDVPSGAFALISGFQAGIDLIKSEAIRAASFTGSLHGGRALLDLAASRTTPIPFYGELGSLNPVIVTRGAAAERGDEIANGLSASFTQSVGQFCTKPGLVFLPAHSELESLIVEAVRHTTGGRMLTPSIANGFAERIDQMASVDGVETLAYADDLESTDDPDWVSPRLLATDVTTLLQNEPALLDEAFGPTTLLVRYSTDAELELGVDQLPGSLTTTVHSSKGENVDLKQTLSNLAAKSGRVVWNGWPTGVTVGWAMQHGGPWPSSTYASSTSVGVDSIRRWLRPVAYQNVPDELLPAELRNLNPTELTRRVNGQLTNEPIDSKTPDRPKTSS